MSPLALRQARAPRRALISVGLVAVMLLGVLGATLAPAAAPAFVVDGHFAEWGTLPSFPGARQDGLAAAADFASPTEVKVHADDRALHVFVKADRALFQDPAQEVVRIFVDADARRATGFDMRDLGADLMVEVWGASGSMKAQGTFRFDQSRAVDDWNGWTLLGRAPVAAAGDSLETVFFGVDQPSTARVVVAVSARDFDAMSSVPAVASGFLRAQQQWPEVGVVKAGESLDGPLRFSLSALGAPQEISELRARPTGRADFHSISSATLTVGASRTIAATIDGAALTFQVDPPVHLATGESMGAQISLHASADFGNAAGASFGLELESFAGPTSIAIQPPHLAPTYYLDFVSPSSVVDGAFGEWALASTQPDPIRDDLAAGRDLISTRALWSGSTGAFFAQTRGDILPGTPLSSFEVRARPEAKPGTPGQGPAPAPEPLMPALSADDRLLVFVDADRNPQTGFQLSGDVPMGAEFVIQVGGRFSEVREARLLAFAGTYSSQSAWMPRGSVAAIAVGDALEGELPAEIAAASNGARLLFQTVEGSGTAADLSAALQEIEASTQDADGLLNFRIATFDPLRGAPPVRAQLLTDVPNGYWVVQFTQPPTEGRVRLLELMGARLFGYVHSNAYLAAFDDDLAQSIRALPGIRWVGIFQPAFKFTVDPLAWGEARLELTVLFFEPAPSFAEMVTAAGGVVLAQTKQAATVFIQGTAASALGFVPEVQFVETAARRAPLNDVGRLLQGVNLTFDGLGLNGSGIIVGISDTGIDFTHPAFNDSGTTGSGPHLDGRIVGYFPYAAAYGDLNGHGTHTAGSIAGDGNLSNTANGGVPAGAVQYRGVAPAARLVITPILASPAPPLDDAVYADQQAYGATVSSNSWGYVDAMDRGITDYDAGAFLADQSVIDSNLSRVGLQPMTIVFAAGNDGSGAGTAGSPGTGKNVITVGASETNRGYDTYSDNVSSIAVFSSRGPTDDGRVKPDVVAVGTYILSTQSRTPSCSCTFGGWDQNWTGPNYAFSSGTSQATPQVAGMVALIQQWYNSTYSRIPSPALIKAALINGAEDLGYGYEYTTGVTGPMSQGWGRVNVTRSIEGPPGGVIVTFDEGAALSTGDVALRRFSVASSGVPLKVTVVWTDPSGTPFDTKTLPELVNDLDLVVRAPNGSYYHGNRFNASWSRLNNTTFDHVNNVENVFVQAPSTGTWTVEVSGFNVRSLAQKFALVVSGNLSEQNSAAVLGAHGFPGAPAGSRFGANFTAVGSFNGDSYVDVAIGAPLANSGAGQVYIFLGGASKSSADLNASRADVVLNGTAGHQFGWSLDASGDFDGDGERDLLIGAPGAGKAYLFRGMASWTARSANVTFNGSSANRFGEAVLLAANLDNATGAEAVVGAPAANSSNGRLYIFSGSGASGEWNTSAANATIEGPAAAGLFGSALAAGDHDGDGDNDLAVGAPGNSTAHVLLGGGNSTSLRLQVNYTGIPGTRFGHSLAFGDFNGDGRKDLAIGAPWANGTAGAAYAFFGATSLESDQVQRVYFFDDMESGSSRWDEMSGSGIGNDSWGLSSTVFYGAAESGHSWQDSTGNYADGEDSSIRFHTPINLSNATSPVLTFVYKAVLEQHAAAWDGFLIRYSTNNGSSWTQLDSSNAQGNYDATVPNIQGPGDSVLATDWAFTLNRVDWRRVTFNVSSLAGQSSVVFRFQFGSDNIGVEDGVYIDEVAVREAAFSSPDAWVSGSGAGDQLGFSVAAIPDLAGVSGLSDLSVGAPFADPSSGTNAGEAYVFTGGASFVGHFGTDNASVSSAGTSPGANLGASVGSVSGFNSSTATYLLVGAPGTSSSAGSATIGDASSAIPELSDVAALAGAVALIGLARIARRRRPT